MSFLGLLNTAVLWITAALWICIEGETYIYITVIDQQHSAREPKCNTADPRNRLKEIRRSNDIDISINESTIDFLVKVL